MANPGDLPVLVLRDRVDSLVTTIGELRQRIDDLEGRLRTFEAIRRIDAVLAPDAEIALIRDGMNVSALGGGE